MGKISPFAGVLSMLLASASYGQTPPITENANANESAGNEDIIVTAQRKNERLQDTPLAVTAVDADTVVKLGLASAVDIGAITPGASFTTTSGFFSTRIRGIGVDFVSVGLEGPVAIYEDGAYLTRTLTVNEIIDNFDIGSIQVLRGPQGTLYGRNATGGVILVNSADPINEFAGKFRVEAGNLDHQQISGMINVPLGQDLAFRATASYKHDGGFVRNLSNGEKAGGGRAYSARAKLRWNPGTTDIVLGAQYYDVAYALGPTTTTGRRDDTCFACGFPGSGTVNGPIGFYEVEGITTVQPVRTEYYGANLKMSFEVGQLNLTSTTTYRKQITTDSASDQDFTRLPIFEFAVPESGGRTFTQDLVAASTFDGSFNFLVGASYFNDNGYFNPTFLGAAFNNPTLNPATAGAFKNSANSKSFAAFLEGYYEISDQLKVTLGGRYTSEKRIARGEINDALMVAFGAGTTGFAFDMKAKQNAFTPRFVLAWDNGPTNIYYSYTRGFKAGGFPGPFPFPLANPVKPEKIASHEIGLKQSMLDNLLRLNAAVFYLKNKDQQSSTLDIVAGGAVTVNAGAMENYGIELEIQANPAEGLTFGFSGAYQHARYKPFINAALVCYDPTRSPRPGGTPGATLYPCPLDATGTAPPGAPDWTASFNAGYEFALGSWTGSLSGLAQYRSAINFTPGRGGQLGTDFDGSRWLVNASGYISPPGENLRLGFYVNNLFDTQILAFQQISQPFGVIKNAGRPRTYGLRMDYSF